MLTSMAIVDLQALILKLPEGEREYAVRFVSKNLKLEPADLLDKWQRDQNDREQAARIQAHREEQVIQEFKDIMRGRGAAAALTGVEAGADAGKAE